MRHLPLLLCICITTTACVPTVSLSTPEHAATAATGALNVEPADVDPLPEAAPETARPLTDIPSRLLENGTLEIGAASAPHTLLLFLTPASPYSLAYHDTLLPRVMREFVHEGTLRIHVAFLPLLRYPDTLAATAALLCMAQDGDGISALAAVMHAPGTLPAGADTEKLRACVTAEPTAARAALHGTFARTLDVTQVPTAFLDGRKETGLPVWVDLRARLRRLTDAR